MHPTKLTLENAIKLIAEDVVALRSTIEDGAMVSLDVIVLAVWKKLVLDKYDEQYADLPDNFKKAVDDAKFRAGTASYGWHNGPDELVSAVAPQEINVACDSCQQARRFFIPLFNMAYCRPLWTFFYDEAKQ